MMAQKRIGRTASPQYVDWCTVGVLGVFTVVVSSRFEHHFDRRFDFDFGCKTDAETNRRNRQLLLLK